MAVSTPPVSPAPAARRPPRADGLTPAQRRAVIAAVAALHGVGGWALLQVQPVRDALAGAAPMFVDFIAPPAPPAPPPPPPPAPVRKKPPPPAPLLAAPPAPTPEPEPFIVPAPPELPPPPEVPAPVMVEAPPAPPPPPKNIPSSAVQYLEPPQLEYPRISSRLGEAGRVMVRVYIDEAGLPHQVQVSTSSGYPRLDAAAVSAVRRARFKPYTENGRPTAGWAFIPLAFDLEK